MSKPPAPGTVSPIHRGDSRGKATEHDKTRHPWFTLRLSRAVASFWQEHRWPILGLLWVGALALGIAGFRAYGDRTGAAYGATDLLYLALQLFTMNSGAVAGEPGWVLDTARFLAPGVAAVTALEALAQVFREQLALIRLRGLRDHVVICGLGSKGLLLARAFRASRFPVVVVERDPLPSSLRECREQQVLVLIGDATHVHTLRRARADRARYVISVCGDDATNALVTLAAGDAEAGPSSGGPLCVLHVSDPYLGRVLRQEERRLSSGHPLYYFNAFEGGARAVVSRFAVFSPGPGTLGPPHYLVAGSGKLAESLVRHLARQWRGHGGGETPCCRITLLGAGASECRDRLTTRDEERLSGCELAAEEREWVTEDGRLRLPGRVTENPVTAVCLCYENDSHAISTALWLAREALPASVPVVICVEQEAGLAALLRADGTGAQLQTFGVLDLACQPALLFPDTLEELAQAIHRDYLADQPPNPTPDPTRVPWEQLSEAFRESNRKQADHVLAKLQAVRCGLAPRVGERSKAFGFTEAEVELLAQMEHERWMAERLLSGWTYGAERDPERKLNPLLCPWKELSPEACEANRARIRRLPQMLSGCGFQVYRLGGY